ncbi:MAG: hypothetical protein SPI53_01420 [Erysipelotrichaceae bacterium]|nr:hypothetical protein [Erysipelotrichaceae bacterium]
MSLTNFRIGVNATRNQIKELGELIKPLLEKGQSVYAILANHPEIGLCEKTIYNYIENGVFQSVGVSIACLDLKRQVRRKVSKKKILPLVLEKIDHILRIELIKTLKIILVIILMLV